jgi:hypothetical protein
MGNLKVITKTYNPKIKNVIKLKDYLKKMNNKINKKLLL